ncbi:hypothetical protein [Streptomyces sulfonofaciens]|uniref:hypothetical protein n=1 Tax=Streptomyces sulfonofaciens TaxID=68272 RepID=UPI001E43AC0B|nr:hypothetical protein [Streptomyces sulfonofaciens]
MRTDPSTTATWRGSSPTAASSRSSTTALPLLAVTRSGCTAAGIRALTPRDLLSAWS